MELFCPDLIAKALECYRTVTIFKCVPLDNFACFCYQIIISMKIPLMKLRYFQPTYYIMVSRWCAISYDYLLI